MTVDRGMQIMGTMKTVAMLAGLAGGGVFAARRGAAAIAANPDPHPYDVISQDLAGDEVWVERPDGTRIRCVVMGDGPTVVLSHGYGAAIIEWNVVGPMLVEAGHRVVAFDWRGHGGSTIGADGVSPEVIAGDHVAIFDALEIDDAVLVGHSTGGYLAIAAMLEQPSVADRVRGLVLVASLAGDAAAHAPQVRAQVPMITSGVMERIARGATTGPLFAASIWGPEPSPAAGRVFLEQFLAREHGPLVPLLQRLSYTGFYDRLGELDVPTVIVCGEADSTTPRSHAEAMAAGIRGSRNVWVPNAGHMLNWQAPEVIVDAITSLVPASA